MRSPLIAADPPTVQAIETDDWLPLWRRTLIKDKLVSFDDTAGCGRICDRHLKGITRRHSSNNVIVGGYKLFYIGWCMFWSSDKPTRIQIRSFGWWRSRLMLDVIIKVYWHTLVQPPKDRHSNTYIHITTHTHGHRPTDTPPPTHTHTPTQTDTHAHIHTDTNTHTSKQHAESSGWIIFIYIPSQDDINLVRQFSLKLKL